MFQFSYALAVCFHRFGHRDFSYTAFLPMIIDALRYDGAQKPSTLLDPDFTMKMLESTPWPQKVAEMLINSAPGVLATNIARNSTNDEFTWDDCVLHVERSLEFIRHFVWYKRRTPIIKPQTQTGEGSVDKADLTTGVSDAVMEWFNNDRLIKTIEDLAATPIGFFGELDSQIRTHSQRILKFFTNLRNTVGANDNIEKTTIDNDCAPSTIIGGKNNGEEFKEGVKIGKKKKLPPPLVNKVNNQQTNSNVPTHVETTHSNGISKSGDDSINQ